MNRDGVRPNRLWHWFAIAVVVATVWHEPGGSAEFAVTVLDKAGSAIGIGLRSAGFEGDSDYFVEQPEATDASPSASEGDLLGSEQGAGIDLEGTADQAVVEIELHELVEAVLADDNGDGGSR